MRTRKIALPVATLLLGMMSASVSADVIEWTDWTSADCSGTTDSATGTMGSVTVSYSGNCEFAQTGTGTNYWTEGVPAPYTGNATVDNAPTASEMIALDASSTNTISFSETVLNPIMAIVSLGRYSEAYGVTYDFDDASFTVLSEGRGYWGEGTYTLGAGDILTGYELHAVIQFNGEFDEISWSSTAEYWHGFTFGAVSEVPEPATLALFGLGLAGIGFARRKRV